MIIVIDLFDDTLVRPERQEESEFGRPWDINLNGVNVQIVKEKKRSRLRLQFPCTQECIQSIFSSSGIVLQPGNLSVYTLL